MTGSFEQLLIGRVLVERYRIEEVIGRGGMSIVLRARDERLGRPVAVKVVSLPSAGDELREHLRERLRREAASSASIPPHPNVVQVYDYGTDPQLDLDFIVMELLRGRDLKEALRAERFPLPEAVRLLREAARGLAAGHRAGIVHRDVKPANLFLVGDREVEAVRVLDFGIAKALQVDPNHELTRTGQLPHSPAYASPEQARHEKSLTPASDVYQLGLVAYELLVGERPFTEAERERIRGGEEVPLPDPPQWRELPGPLRAIVARALRPRPEDRFPDAAALAEALAVDLFRVDTELMEEDATIAVAPGRTVTVAPDPPPSHLPGVAAPVPRAPAGRSIQLPARRTAALAGTVLAGLLLIWALTRLGGGSSGDAAPAPAADMAALTDEFRSLQRQAVESLRESEAGVSGPGAAAAVGRVIADLSNAFVHGELDRHLSHYADRVRWYGDRTVRTSRIRDEREELLERYPEREIVLTNQAIEFREPGEARVLVDRSWVYRGGRDRWTGASRQELILELEDGDWKIVSERDLETYRSERDD